MADLYNEKLNADCQAEYTRLTSILDGMVKGVKTSDPDNRWRLECSLDDPKAVAATLYAPGFTCSIMREDFGKKDQGVWPGVRLMLNKNVLTYRIYQTAEGLRWAKWDKYAVDNDSQERLTTLELAALIFEYAHAPESAGKS